MLIFVPQVPYGILVDGGGLRIGGFRSVCAAMGVKAQLPVAEEGDAGGLRRVKGACDEALEHGLLFRTHFRPAVREETLFCPRCVKGEVCSDAEDALLRCTVVVAVVEDVVHPEIDHGILAQFLLHHEIPDAEALFLIGFVGKDGGISFENVRIVVGAVGEGVAVEHLDVVVTPELGRPARFLILVADADVELMRRPIEQAFWHERVGLIDRVEIGVAEFGAEMRTDFTPYLCFETRDLRFADVLEAVNHVGCTHPFLRLIEPRGKVHEFPREVDRHVVADAVVENADTCVCVLGLAFDACVDVDGGLGL